MRYVYIRDSKGFPLACAAIYKHGTGSVYVGVSVYRPGDKFNRGMAREIAAGRAVGLAQGRLPDFSFRAMTHDIEPGTSFVADVYQEILNSRLCNPTDDDPFGIYLPTRVIRAMEDYLSD